MTEQELTDLKETALAWANDDVDEADAATVRRLVDAGETDELASRFAGPLQFGTAGLRGEVGAGQTRMNRAVVIKATAGLTSYLKEKLGGAETAQGTKSAGSAEGTGSAQAATPRIVIGHDARHGSAEFARDAAEVIAAAGGQALRLPSHLPTPLLAFAVRHLNADAGIMVTASHNPPRDNGYKVYLGGRLTDDNAAGVQIVPPDDAGIAAHIAATGAAKDIPRSTEGIIQLGDEVREAYLTQLMELTSVFHLQENFSSDIAITLTPMHGVGGETALMALRRAGFTNVSMVAAQAEPDPDFPTVSFPNPEERGALDLAKEDAIAHKADVIIALDPDADRCSVAVPNADKSAYQQLTGDQIGAILGDFVAGKRAIYSDSPVLASSIVSSRLLSKIAADHGCAYQPTLTGFKWIGRTPDLVFGYEEAIGYCCYPSLVRDKDGVSAAVTVAYLVDTLRRQGQTIENYLDFIALQHGVYATSQAAFRVDDLSLLDEGMKRLRTTPPTSFAGSPVVESVDLAQGYRGLPGTNGLLFITEDDSRVVCRPSGTEPKLKCYLEVVLPLADAATSEDLAQAQQRAAEKLETLRAEVTQATGF